MPAEGGPTSKKGTIQNYWEGRHQPRNSQQARREQYKILGKEDTGRRSANKPEGNNTKFWGRRMPAKGRPTSKKGTIQNYWEGRHRPRNSQQARRKQYKILGKEDTGQRLANKPEGINTKFWGRRLPAEGQPTS